MRLNAILLWACIPLSFAVAAAIGQTPDKNANIKEITQWARSGHADARSEAFSHWNDDGVIPPLCSTCHSGAGFRALYGFDGSEPGLPEHPVPVGGVVDCDTCHNPGLQSVTEISLPSGKQHPVAGYEAACMTCHQGLQSGAGVTAALADRPEDEIGADLRFIGPHYATAAASLLGGSGALGYQYPGKSYEPRFTHARPVASCTSCHEPHNLTVAEDTCLTCHDTGDDRKIRISRQSYDGSGDLKKGIHDDIAANRDRLYGLMQAYAQETANSAFVYDGARYPYFFADHNRDGVPDQKDGAAVTYAGWTPRLLKATYNWLFVGADAGIHVHNPHYALQLLYDSADDLSASLGRELTDMVR